MPTVVFADINGNTGLFGQMGDAKASILINSVTGLLGDGVFAVLPDAGNAVAACVSLQSRLQTDPITPTGCTHRIQMQMRVESGNQAETMAVRRAECLLVGFGQLSLGCKIDAEKAPLVTFEVS